MQILVHIIFPSQFLKIKCEVTPSLLRLVSSSDRLYELIINSEPNSSQKANFSMLIFIFCGYFCGSLYLLVQSNLSL